MKQKLFLVLGLISLWGFVNCIGPFKKEEENKDTENLVLLELASTEELAINGTWGYSYTYPGTTITSTNVFSGKKSLLTGTTGSFTLKQDIEPDNINFPDFERTSDIVDFNNQLKTIYLKDINEPANTDCNGNGTKEETGVACYSRIQWTISYVSALQNDGLYICITARNKGSLDEAKNDPTTADANDLERGCPTPYGNIGWTLLGTKQ